MTMSLLLEHFDGLLATQDDVEQLNAAIVQLALQGKLAPQDSSEDAASELLKKIARSDGNKEIPVVDIASLQLPKNWSAEYLGVIAEQITKGSTPTTYGFQFQSEGIRFIKVENVKNGRIVLGNIKDFISEEANRAQVRSQLQAGDVLFSIAGTIGETCVVKLEDLPANTNQALAIIRGTQIIFDPKFLKLQLDSFVANAIKGRARGGAMNNVSLGDLRQLLVFIPPFAEQQRIIARVEELFVQTRALAKELAHSQIELDGLNKSALSHLLASETPEEFNQHWAFIAEHFDLLFQTPEHVAPLRQSVLELAVRGKLTQNTHDWKTESLEDISSDADYGTSQKCDYGASDTPVLRIPNVAGGKINLDNLKHATKPEELGKEKSLVPNDFLIVRTNGSKDLVGKGSVVMQEFDNATYFASYLIRYRLINYGAWINTIWNSRLIRDQVEKIAATSAGQYNVNIKNLNSIQIPIPPLAEQERIVKRVEQLLSLCDALEARLQSAEEERGRLVRAVMAGVGGRDGE